MIHEARCPIAPHAEQLLCSMRYSSVQLFPIPERTITCPGQCHRWSGNRNAPRFSGAVIVLLSCEGSWLCTLATHFADATGSATKLHKHRSIRSERLSMAVIVGSGERVGRPLPVCHCLADGIRFPMRYGLCGNWSAITVVGAKTTFPLSTCRGCAGPANRVHCRRPGNPLHGRYGRAGQLQQSRCPFPAHASSRYREQYMRAGCGWHKPSEESQ